MNVEKDFKLSAMIQKNELLEGHIEALSRRIEKSVELLKAIHSEEELEKEVTRHLRDIEEAAIGIRVYGRELL